LSAHIHIGKLAATHGLNGEFILKHSLGKKTVFKTTEAIFIEVNKNELLPYFPETSAAKNDADTIIKIEGIDTKEAAAKLLQKKVWLTKKDFEALVSKTAPVNLIDFFVVNEGENLGTVEAVIEQPQQVLLQLTINSKEVLIPVNESTLQKIDRKKKEVHVSLPEGLLEIYLG
jgi:16S rRNA processing protein RimM